MRVVFLIEDSLPNRFVGPELTPTLCSLIESGGWHPDGGVSVLASSTFPNHATFATGRDVESHRIFANDIWEGSSFVASPTVGPVGDTVFKAARRAGYSTAAILGDTTMIGCMGAAEADISWPPPGDPPPGLSRDLLGYPANRSVIEALGNSHAEALDTDLLYIHLNEPDSTLHRYGPDAPEARRRIREVDDDLATIVEILRPRWDETVLFVVSDHDQEVVDHELEPIDLPHELATAGLSGIAHNEGMIGIVYDSPGARRLKRLPMIQGASDVAPGVTIAWSERGRVFASGSDESAAARKTIAGQHGSPRTRTQVASVTGGHRAVGLVAQQISQHRPYATDYAPMISELLNLPLTR